MVPHMFLPQTMMQKWHWNAPLESIKRGNVADLMAYGFWYKTRAELEAEGLGHIPDQLVSELEEVREGIHMFPIPLAGLQLALALRHV